MPNAARVNFNIKNFTTEVSTPLQGVIFVMGITKRGPVEQPELPISLVNSWAQFEKVFGGLMDTSDFPLLCRRAFSRGAILRVCRIDSTATPSVKATAKNIANGDGTPVTLFQVQPKYKGADYNNISIEIKAASNGNSSYWDMAVTHALEPDLNEYYANIPSFVKASVNSQTCLDDVKRQSKLLDFTYVDASTATLLIPAVAAASAFTGGVDPTGQVAADYSSALTAFDGVDDAMVLAIPEMDDDAINAAGAAYASTRGDLVFFGHLPNSITTAAALVTERGTISSNTKYLALYGGGMMVRHPETLEEVDISEMGDILGLVAYVHTTFGPWYSLAGQVKGAIPDSLGVVNNFGTPAKFADLNTLANAQINMAVVKNNVPQLSGNFSAQFQNNSEKFLNVVFLVIWLKKVLKPILEEYFEEPNDLITFRRIYNHVLPLLTSLTSPQTRALYKFEYYGDQDATSLDNLQINDPVDVQNGKYKINLKIWPIPSLQELTLNLMLVQGEGVTIG